TPSGAVQEGCPPASEDTPGVPYPREDEGAPGKGPSMRLTVADEVVDLFPAFTLGILDGEVGPPEPGFPERIRSLQEAALDRLRAQATDVERLMEHPHVRLWREAYQRFGARPTKFRPTHEAFARRLLKEPSWPAIGPLVDVYLTNQAAHLLPHGGYDRDRLEGDLRLARSPGARPSLPP